MLFYIKYYYNTVNTRSYLKWNKNDVYVDEIKGGRI